MDLHDATIDDVLLERLDQIEGKIDKLTTLMSIYEHTLSPAQSSPLLLVGWNEIAKALRKSPRTLRRYVRQEGLPIFRWGRHVVITTTLLDNWLLAREVARQAEPWPRNPDMYGGPKVELNDPAYA